ncbi:MAG: glycosyltransferase family protein [Bacteroidia bacterium]
MKVLYAIQGTGNGHVSRAREVIPYLKSMCDVDIFLSGANTNIPLPCEVKYKSKGFSFEYNKKGGLDYLNTLSKTNPRRLWKEINDFPVEDYDLIINDFECITAYAARKKHIPVMAFSHQAALLSGFTPKPAGVNLMGNFVLERYAPTQYAVGLHFREYDDYIFTPIIRKEVRQLQPFDGGHYTVYLPAVGDKDMLDILHKLPDVRWEVFSRTIKNPLIDKNVSIRPVQNEQFLRSLGSCSGILTGAGFESPAEALFLNKKVFVIPIKGQFEQACNAEALSHFGVPSVKKFNQDIIPVLKNWIECPQQIKIHFPDITEQLIEQMLFDHNPFFVPTLAVG